MSRTKPVSLPKLRRRQSLQLGTATAATSLRTTKVAIKPEITMHLHNLHSAPANTSEGGTQND